MSAPALASPYRGLAPFEDSETDARLFFGRERERTVILANLMASRLTVLYGASGVGKSSLLGAGVAHELGKTDDVAVLRSWADDPIASLISAADRAEDGAELYLILDQLEEFFVYHGSDGPANELAEALAELLRRPDVRVSVLLGIREDSLAKLDAFKPRLPDVLANYLRLEHLDRDAARAAITEPLRRFEEVGGASLTIDAALVEAVLDEVSAGRIDGGAAPVGHIETPYLQLVMQRLWEVEREQGSSVLRLATLRKLGGAERIVRDHLERALSALTPAQQDAAARMFDHLVTPSGAKIAHHVGDLALYAGVADVAARGVIARLEGERIVRPADDGRVEIYHDVLGEPISTWRRSYEATRELQRAKRRSRRLAVLAGAAAIALVIVSAVAVYALSQRREARKQATLAREAVITARAEQRETERQRRRAIKAGQGFLRERNRADDATDDALSQAKRAEKNLERAIASEADTQDALDAAERAQNDLRQSRDVAQDQTRLARNETRRANAATETAQHQTREARRQARINKTHQLISDSLLTLGTDSEQGVRLAEQASRLQPSGADAQRVEDALRDALASFRLQTVLPAGSPSSLRALLGAMGSPPLAEFSPDSKYIATAAAGGQVRLFYNRPSGGRVRAFKPSTDAADLSFSPDGAMLLAAGRDGRALLWNVASGRRLQTFAHPGLTTGDFTWDGQFVVTGGTDGVVRAWDAASGRPRSATDVGGPVRSLELQNGGRFAVAVTTSNSARVVDLVTGKVVATLDRPGGITIAAFSPDGDFLVAGGGSGDGYVFDARGRPRRTLKGHVSKITDLAFASDNESVMTTSADTTARVWLLANGKLTNTFTARHKKGVLTGDASSRADSYLTGSADGTAALWLEPYLPGGEVILDGHGGPVGEAAFSPDGWTILTASADGNVRLWRARDPNLHLVGTQEERTTAAEFSPSGDRLVTVDASGTLRLENANGVPLKEIRNVGAVTDIAYSRSGWFATAGPDGIARLFGPDGSPRSMLPHGSPIRTLAMTDDARLIATGGADGRTLVFDRSGRVVRDLAQGAPVTSVALRGSDTLVSGGADGSVKVWDLRRGGGRSLTPHNDAVNDISFSRGGLLATASDDKTVHIYVLRTGVLSRPLLGHGTEINLVLFRADGRMLLTASTDGHARVWSTKDWSWKVLRGRRPPEVSAVPAGALNDARFSPDGRWIVTAGPSAAGIWQARTADLLFFIRGHKSAVRAATFAADNRRMMTAGADGTMRDYDCKLCGKLPELQKLARGRLALAGRGR